MTPRDLIESILAGLLMSAPWLIEIVRNSPQ
jgi:hypothetical protein